MRNLMSFAFRLLKMPFWVPKKGQLSFLERREVLRFSENGQKTEYSSSPEYPNIKLF